MNFDKHLFRASSIGKIISKSGKLTDGIKTHLEEVFITELYGVQKDITSKYFDKGIACEQDGLDILSKCVIKSFAGKNKEEFQNEYVKGTPDCLHKDMVFDIKNAYDLFSFGKASATWDYEWQVRAYQYLTGITRGYVLYCLADMPDFLFADEEKKLFYQGKFLSYESEDFIQASQDLKRKLTYDYMRIEDKFKLFEIECTNQHFEIMIESVMTARKYLNELHQQYLDRVKFNNLLITNGLPI
jgi:hypothetical protein